jgi:outer membrane protein assembly factor BamB
MNHAKKRAIVLSLLLATTVASSASQSKDWPVGRGNYEGTAVGQGTIPTKPTVLWEFKTKSDKAGFEATPIIAFGKVFVGDFDGTMYAIDFKTGAEVWSKKTKDGFVTAAAAKDGKVIVGDFSGQVYCFDAVTGEQLWVHELDQQVASGPSFYEDNVLITSEGGSMLALSLNDGKEVWNYATGDQLRSSPSLWKGKSLLGGCDGRLHKVDVKEGKATGSSVPLEGPTLATSSIIGNMAIVPTQPGAVLGIDVSQDKVVWTFSDQELSNDIRSSPAALGQVEGEKAKGIAVVTTRNRRVLGLSIENGEVLWKTLIKKRSDSSPVIGDGRAWLAAADGQVYALDIKTGQETWTYQLSGQILSSPAIADGKLVITTEKGSVVCFGEN